MHSRKRNLNYTVPVIVPLTSRCRLVADDPSNSSLSDVASSYAQKVVVPDFPVCCPECSTRKERFWEGMSLVSTTELCI